VTDLFLGEPMSEHPAVEVVAAYLSGTLASADAAAFEAHLASCRPCRQEMLSAGRLIASHRPRSRGLLVTSLTAAAVLAVVLVARGSRSAEEPVRGENRVGTERTPGLRALAPADRDTVEGRGLAFTWSSQSGRPLYRLTLTDASGHALWLRDTPDTTLALPLDVALPGGGTYFWYVDALDADGRSVTTGTRRFTIPP
jgi:putative zinc finger protein